MTTSLAACHKQRHQKRSFAGAVTTLLIPAAFMARSRLWATDHLIFVSVKLPCQSCCLLALGWCGKCHDAEYARTDTLGDRLDRAALAGAVTPLEDDADLEAPLCMTHCCNLTSSMCSRRSSR